MTVQRPPVSAESVGRSTRLIFLSLPMGILLMAAVCVFLVRSGVIPLNPEGGVDEGMLLLLWIAVALGAAMGAVLIWRGQVEPIVGDRTADGAPAANPERASRLATHLIVCWALIEAPALFGLVLFMLTGDWMLFALGLTFALLGFSLAAPRQAWFRAEGSH